MTTGSTARRNRASDVNGDLRQNHAFAYRRALDLRRRTGDRAAEAATLNNLGLASGLLGDHPAVRAHPRDEAPHTDCR
ncbi:hypothetical protein [Longispora fulva]|uniref:Tetratricopeptide repeat protein n=1 Tax=Longispora fulva TaxID=619741 RepID=A0A8J7GCU4_9ACTN|nr:hypothetical protein [Longispora fulva]MBG6135680.1 hypothetical protein [Longispora fulva]